MSPALSPLAPVSSTASFTALSTRFIFIEPAADADALPVTKPANVKAGKTKAHHEMRIVMISSQNPGSAAHAVADRETS
jgi:hypothetical protein